jgi:alpha,alpha-trehalose phosphorylase
MNPELFDVPVRELHRDFGEDPWRLVVHGLDPALSGQDETLFSLGNGYLGLRGNHEEGLPLGSHGTFVNDLAHPARRERLRFRRARPDHRQRAGREDDPHLHR